MFKTLLLSFMFSLPAYAVTYQDVKPIIDRKCATCHRATFDLTQFPFQNSHFPNQEAIVAEMLRRVELPDTDTHRMPPRRVSVDPLPVEEIALLRAWLDGGLQH